MRGGIVRGNSEGGKNSPFLFVIRAGGAGVGRFPLSREWERGGGMGKWGEWGSAGAGEETKKITKKYPPIPAKAGISRWLGQDGQRPACTELEFAGEFQPCLQGLPYV